MLARAPKANPVSSASSRPSLRNPPQSDISGLPAFGAFSRTFHEQEKRRGPKAHAPWCCGGPDLLLPGTKKRESHPKFDQPPLSA